MKISQQPVPHRYLLFALVATMVVVMVGAQDCSDVVGAGPDCEQYCSSTCSTRFPGARSACEDNTCKCYHECPKTKKCNMGLGRCSQSCDPKCCADKCASVYPGGVGYCDDSLGSQYALCQCQYPC